MIVALEVDGWYIYELYSWQAVTWFLSEKVHQRMLSAVTANVFGHYHQNTGSVKSIVGTTLMVSMELTHI